MIKFNQHNVKANGHTVKVYYSINGHMSGKNCVTIRVKSILDSLLPIFSGKVKNNSDFREDYFEKDRVIIFEGELHYEQSLVAAKKAQKKFDR